MKKYFFLVWTFIVMILCTSILYIGVYEKKNAESIYIKNAFKEIAKKYIELENIKIEDTYTIKNEDLLKNQYNNVIEYEGKICTADIRIDKIFIFKKYIIDYKCEEVIFDTEVVE